MLAIKRADGSYVGAPGPETEIQPGDTVVLYGQQHRLQELADRKSDDTQARADAVKDHQNHVEGEEWSSPSFALEQSEH
ncbi:TrkA C-terminal domain-containing protein [Halalkalicoccus salilacus]